MWLLVWAGLSGSWAGPKQLAPAQDQHRDQLKPAQTISHASNTHLTSFFSTGESWRYVLWCPLHRALMALFHCMVRHGTVQNGSLFWGGFPLSTVPGTFLVPPRPGFQEIRTVTKTWRINSTDHWLARENHCITELVTRDPTYTR